MTTLHVAHALRMQLPRSGKDDEYDGAFELATRERFECVFRKPVYEHSAARMLKHYECRELCVPRANLCYPTLKEAIERIPNFEHTVKLPDTLAITFDRKRYNLKMEEYCVDQSTLRCPSSLQLTVHGQQHMYQLVGAMMASTDAQRPHEAYVLLHGLTNEWCVATDGDALMDCEMCPSVSVQALNYYLDGYASSASGDATHYKYPLRLWYRSQAALVCNSEAAEERQMQAETERILENKYAAEREAMELQHALADQHSLAQREVKEQEKRLRNHRPYYAGNGLPPPHQVFHLKKELEKLQAEERAAWERLVATKAETRSDKRSRKAAIEARRLWEAKEAQRRVRELNEHAAERRAAPPHAR